MEIKVNDYVRTKKGIAKIIDRINDPTNYYDKFWVCDRYLELNDDTEYIHEQDIIGEPKEKIIELIEAGDYVNGKLVKHIAYFEGVEEPIKKLIFSDEYHLIPTEVCEENEIKSIVIKEQFEQMEYKIESEVN